MKKKEVRPPGIFLRFFRWFCHPGLRDSVEGDLMELYNERITIYGKKRADIRFMIDVLLLFRPGIIKPQNHISQNIFAMYKNYFRIGIRNIRKNRGYSFINISGLAAGMSVAMLIGLWIWDEISFNRYNPDADRIAMVIQNVTFNGKINTWWQTPFPLGEELRNSYGNDFKYVVTSTGSYPHTLDYKSHLFSEEGLYAEPQVTRLLHLQVLKGSIDGLQDPSSVMLSETLAKTLFGDTDPMNKTLLIDNKTDVKVTGVYRDPPENSSFSDVHFILPWEQLVNVEKLKDRSNPWRANSFYTYVELAKGTGMKNVSEKIRDIKLHKVRVNERSMNPRLFLYPMNRWHLYNEFDNGVNAGGRIDYVWLFGIIGIFVLLLACINFMNLSTAHSEKRSKEVGIRKVAGSLRSQLISMFYSESILISFFAFFISILVVRLLLPFFNEIAGKKLSLLWDNPWFWMAGIGFTLLTGFIAGSYPAIYLSSFRPAKALKGSMNTGHRTIRPRRILVVLQFTISVVLIIGTMVVFRQIQFARERHIGFNRKGLINSFTASENIHKHFEAIKDELKHAGAITDMAESSSPVTSVWSTSSGFSWPGKDPGLSVIFPNTIVSYDYGKTVGWQFLEGRDFSRDFASDSNAYVINEAAMKFMGLKDPVGQVITKDGQPHTIIGVIRNVIMESPYEPVRPSVFRMFNVPGNCILIKLNPAEQVTKALSTIEMVFKKYDPSQPFSYRFVDEEYAKKFGNEERIGKLSSGFAFLAIFISCLGIFGLSSFMAEKRTKEIGIRKVLGASLVNIWKLLSGDFLLLVCFSCVIAVPVSWYFMNQWLQGFTYRMHIPWWIFVLTSTGALIITLLTVSYQAIHTALRNPVISLRSE